MDEYNVDRSGETIRKPQVNTELLAKWTGILFWLVIVSVIADLLTSENISGLFSALYFAGQILNVAEMIGYGIILWIISSESIHYRNAAICQFITAVLGIILIPVSGESDFLVAVPAALLSVISGMTGVYYEIKGHMEVLRDVDPVLSDKWHKLWKWYIGAFLGIFAGAVVSVLIPLIGLLLVFASTVGMLVVSVLKIIYIYKMSKVFRAYSAS